MLLSLYNTLTRQKRILLIIGLLGFLFAAGGAAIYLGSVVRNARDTGSNPPGDTNVSTNKPGSISGNRPSDDKSLPSGESNTPATPGEGNPAVQPGSQAQGGGSSAKPSTSGGSNSSNTGSTPKPTTPTTPNPTPTPTPTCPSGQTGTPPNCTTPAPKPLGVAGSWTLKFQDEFNGSSLNTNVWATQRGEANGSYGDPYNPQYEDAFYVANNPKVSGGNLVLTLNKGTTNGYPYSSGMVQNGRSFSYKYGYTEARVKVPGNAGVWPAYWTLAS
ncbi:MAG: glycosyl hydrolase family protein, partial [Chloroflexi bacterium]